MDISKANLAYSSESSSIKRCIISYASSAIKDGFFSRTGQQVYGNCSTYACPCRGKQACLKDMADEVFLWMDCKCLANRHLVWNYLLKGVGPDQLDCFPYTPNAANHPGHYTQ